MNDSDQTTDTSAESGNGAKPNFQLGIDAQMLVDRLLKAAVGDTITYQEMTDLIGRDVRGAGYGSLMSARRVLLRDHETLFGAVTKVGLKRLSDTEKLDVASSRFGTIRRASRRSLRILASVEYARLSEADRLRHQTFFSVHGALEVVSKPAAIKRVEREVERTQAKLPLAKVLEAFGGN